MTDRREERRPDLLKSGKKKLSVIERLQISFIRSTFDLRPLASTIRWCQRNLGSLWIHHCTKHLRQIHGLDRLPELDLSQSYVCVSNHRSFFDMYVITGDLVRRGLKHRILFPVRSRFFYDSVLGFFVNGLMSFFAMYPPLFRERKRAALNLVSLDEAGWRLRKGGCFIGLHPEGRRNVSDDPYSLLEAQRGVGRLIYRAGVPVLPVFINGLSNDLKRQVTGNFNGKGDTVHVVFGAPVPLDDLLEGPDTPPTHRRIAQRALDAVARLGEEERTLREASATAPSAATG